MKLTSHVHAIKIPFSIPLGNNTFAERYVFVFLLVTDLNIWLIDSGVAGSEQAVYDYIESLGRAPEDITRIILTHGHPDHIGAAAAIQQRTGCSVLAHSGDRAWMEDIELQHAERPVPGFFTLVGGPVVIDHCIDGDIELNMDNGFPLRIVATPGHSPGSISVSLPQDRVLITGDSIPVGNEMPIYDDVAALVQSIGILRKIPDISILLSSWDTPRITNIASIFDRALDYIHTIHQAVGQRLLTSSSDDIAEICGMVAHALMLSPDSVTPMSFRAIASHIDALKQSDVL